ncbi:MAG: anaerobic sulfatase maturase, partial [Planctomycetota bacterium]|nr:anaerobic sulfatase maturase [Planctomycetota bacterium]
TIMGREFFALAVELQQKYCPDGATIRNALQTNGTLLDDAFCEFFQQQGFLIGLSCDGPPELHDPNRVDKGGKPSHHRVMDAAALLRKHQVEFNILCTVNRTNARQPLKVYKFLSQLGAPCIQFIPLVERWTEHKDTCDIPLAKAPQIEGGMAGGVTPFSVRADDYGHFLNEIFDYWVRHDVGRVFVQMFDIQLANICGQPGGLCVFAETCGRGLVMEHNGDVYACDHYVYDEYKLGNAYEQPIAEMVNAPEQDAFGKAKRDTLPKQCQECPYLRQCWGGCPKQRFAIDRYGEDGLNYLCPSYFNFFKHSRPYFERMAGYLSSGLPPAMIMDDLRNQAASAKKIKPNEPCPCGSGKKYKKCCGRC